MFCPKCGNHINDGAAFCTQCGYAVPVTQNAPREYQSRSGVAAPQENRQPYIGQAMKTVLIILAAVALGTAFLGHAILENPAPNVFRYALLPYSVFLISMVLLNKIPAVFAASAEVILLLPDLLQFPVWIEDGGYGMEFLLEFFVVSFVVMLLLELATGKKVFKIIALILAILITLHEISYPFNTQILRVLRRGRFNDATTLGKLIYYMQYLAYGAARILLVLGIRCNVIESERKSAAWAGIKPKKEFIPKKSIITAVILISCAVVLRFISVAVMMGKVSMPASTIANFFRSVLVPYGILLAAILLANKWSSKILTIPVAYMAVLKINEILNYIYFGSIWRSEIWTIIADVLWVGFAVLFILWLFTGKTAFKIIAAVLAVGGESQMIYYGGRYTVLLFRYFGVDPWSRLYSFFIAEWFSRCLLLVVFLILLFTIKSDRGRC